jgi:hypothetical protein
LLPFAGCGTKWSKESTNKIKKFTINLHVNIKDLSLGFDDPDPGTPTYQSNKSQLSVGIVNSLQYI